MRIGKSINNSLLVFGMRSTVYGADKKTPAG